MCVRMPQKAVGVRVLDLTIFESVYVKLHRGPVEVLFEMQHIFVHSVLLFWEVRLLLFLIWLVFGENIGPSFSVFGVTEKAKRRALTKS